jgi:hypothetical protein
MSQASRIRLSPLEEQLLDRLGGEWATLHELQRELFPDHAPLYVKAALRYLRRQGLARQLDREYGTPMFERTELGHAILAETRRRPVGVA